MYRSVIAEINLQLLCMYLSLMLPEFTGDGQEIHVPSEGIVRATGALRKGRGSG